jgi:hypothetical protein
VICLLLSVSACQQSEYEKKQAESEAYSAAMKQATVEEKQKVAKLNAEIERINKERGIVSEETVGVWTVEMGKDRIDDTPFAILHSSGEQQIFVKCSHSGTQLYINTGEIVENGRIRLRVGKEPPTSENWTVSTDYTALFSPSPVALAKDLERASSLLIEYRSHENGTRVAELSTVDFEQALDKVKNVCSWRRSLMKSK